LSILRWMQACEKKGLKKKGEMRREKMAKILIYVAGPNRPYPPKNPHPKTKTPNQTPPPPAV